MTKFSKIVLPIATVLIICFSIFFHPRTPYCIAADSPQNKSDILPQDYTPEEVDKALNQLNDRDVRQLLSHELKNRADDESNTFNKGIPGPGAFLDSILSYITSTSTESERRILNLIENIPQIYPDLYKVFLTL
jgi:hypothetical protein